MKNLSIIEQLSNASNGAFRAELEGKPVIFKPNHLERELWDFPTGTLVFRERATFLMSEFLGWNLVPNTELISTDHGVGSIQDWVTGECTLVDIIPSVEISSPWLSVLEGQNESGLPVSLVHQDDEILKRIALLDVLVNNADRKGGHLLTDEAGKTSGIDHGVTFHPEPKLRTVLWGWAGQPIPEGLLQDVRSLPEDLSETELGELLTEEEIDATHQRIAELVNIGEFPTPSQAWPSLPWPLF